MKISEKAIELLHGLEGCRLTAYDDRYPNKLLTIHAEISGTLTIGFGHTGADVVIGQTITKERANELFKVDIARFERQVTALLKVDTSQNQFDALILFAYNLGAGALSGSTLLKLHNASDFVGAEKEFKKWINGTFKGVKTKLRGLVRRRFSEALLYSAGVVNPYPSGWDDYARLVKAI